MSLPPVREFRREANSRRWVASSERGDYDLAVPGEGEGPRESALKLLEEADDLQSELFKHARHYLASFCQAPEYGLASEPTLIELEVTECRGQPVVSVVFNFESDLYGLWTVAFSRAAPGRWIPASFRRENW
jgi:hypothetical protein